MHLHLTNLETYLENVFSGDPNPDINQEMGDPNKKELTDEEMEKFDEKRSEAMQTFSEVKLK